ncbi:MAG TPA: hypothetical protein VNL73_02520 [Verrucomicrobiae bacterium]|nr:hypothetical protein [Verrucomicrobiae bacterium]
MSPVEMKKVFEDLRDEISLMAAGVGPEKTMINEVWVELKYNPVIRQLGLHLDCNTGTFEISEGQYSPRAVPEQNPITGELALAPRFVSGALMLKKLDSVLALIDERVPLDTLRDKPQPEQKPVLQRAS